MVAEMPLVALCWPRNRTVMRLEDSWSWIWNRRSSEPSEPETRSTSKSAIHVRLGAVPTVPYRMIVPKGFRSSQYAARNGLVWFAVGRQVLVRSAPPDVLDPNSIHPFVDRTSVV